MAYYPTTLPGPTKSVHTPKARVSSPNLPGVGAYSARERDYSGTQDVEFFLEAAQAAAWYAWWKGDLVEGGKWFNANWPALRPGFLTLQFITEPVFTHVYNGAHRISATVQVRGASLEVQKAVDPFYSSAILIYNMREAVGVAPPVDESLYAKVYTTYGSPPLYGVDSRNGPFAYCGSNNQIYNSEPFPSRSAATDAAWGFNSATQTLTVEGWFKAAAVGGSARLSMVRPIASAGSGVWFWPWFFYTGGVLRAGVDVIGLSLIDTSSGASANTWVHYVAQHTGTTVYLGVAGARIGSGSMGILNTSNLMLQFGGTSIGTNVGSGGLLGPHRVTVANRYNLDTSTTYAPPTTYFPGAP